MYLGEIVEQAPVDELFYDTKHPYTDALLNSIPRPDRTVDELEAIEGVMPEAIDPPSGCRFHPRCPDARAVSSEFIPTRSESPTPTANRIRRPARNTTSSTSATTTRRSRGGGDRSGGGRRRRRAGIDRTESGQRRERR